MQRQFFLAASLVLLLTVNALAKAAYKDKNQMIVSAAIIAVVEITSVEKASVKGRHWTYGQKASARVEKVVKGQIPNNISLYGDEDFICAKCRFNVGRYLVFLDRDGELLVGNNWQLSTRKLTADTATKVEWFANDNSFSKKEELLTSVLKEIQQVLAAARPSEPKRD